MTPEQQSELAALKAALKQHIEEAEKATPGPWKHNPGRRMVISVDSLHEDAVLHGDEFELSDLDAAFIARARTMSPLACRIALFAIGMMECGCRANDKKAEFDLSVVLAISKGGKA